MKFFNKYTWSIIGLSALLATSSCNKFLDKNPDNRTELDSPEKIALLLGTAYPQACYNLFYESASDNAADRGISTTQDLRNSQAYMWQYVENSDQDSPEYYWTHCFTAIAAANQALASIQEAGNTKEYESEKGEALLCRAYAHFMLGVTFAPIYDPQSDNSTIALPYVEAPEKVVLGKYTRISVKEYWDKIEKDLTEGLPLLNDDRYSRPKWHFTRIAASAFAARFYLFKKDYQKVVDYANMFLPNATLSSYMRPWNTTYLNYTATEQQTNYTKSDQNAILLEAESSSLWARFVYGVRYGLDTKLMDKIIAGSNVTGGAWAMNNKNYYYGGNPDKRVVLKWNEYFVRQSVNADIGYPYVMVPLLTAEEVLFNRAEAYAYLGKTDSSLADLNVYAASHVRSYTSNNNVTLQKINNFYSDGDVNSKLIQTILDFKRAEFLQEGLRWLDILRHKIPVLHTSKDGWSDSLTANDTRRVFEIPVSAKQGFTN